MSSSAATRAAASKLRDFLALPRHQQTPRDAIAALSSVASTGDAKAALRDASVALDKVDRWVAALDRARPVDIDWAFWEKQLPIPGVVDAYKKAFDTLVKSGGAHGGVSREKLLAQFSSFKTAFEGKSAEIADLRGDELKNAKGKLLEELHRDFPLAAPKGNAQVPHIQSTLDDLESTLLSRLHDVDELVGEITETSSARVKALERRVAAAEEEMSLLLGGTIGEWVEKHPEEAAMLLQEVEDGDWTNDMDAEKVAKYNAMKEKIAKSQ